ncbi:DUF1636 domain-containing protein [Amorphus orientalis]|uniref:Metal-binding protein n=1 Tax=Amorphus orientalis TaxID=649198 RepID=A0AAE4ASW2_9HYPH|nr:DUF1636 domain-containing protein [Amorphus orientalis]MDQ0315688.1 putative metal-binding protein [Amorphus orientalis]
MTRQLSPTDEPVRLMVCTTCRAPGMPSDDPARPGARLHAALEDRLARDPDLAGRIAIEPVECLSVCKRPCTVAVSGPDRWTYVYGDLDAEHSADTILAGIGLYAETADGIVPWRQRPTEFKKGVVARIPPMKTGDA